MRHIVEGLPEALSDCVNLASARLGARVVSVSDAFFGAPERMLSPAAPVFKPDAYDANGKWMDGWETRRRRGPGHDWCVLRLGAPGLVRAVEIDTAHFTGNYAPAASLYALDADPDGPPPGPDAPWRPLLPARPLGPDQRVVFPLDAPTTAAWVKLEIHPDGGVARLKLWGRPRPPWEAAAARAAADELSALGAGGRILGYSDAHYGAVEALLLPGRGETMGDGWETRRRREPGFDWIVVALGAPGRVSRIEIDTAHFKGNFPERAGLRAAWVPPGLPDAAALNAAMFWPSLLPDQPLQADHVHVFEGPALWDLGVVSHVRLDIHPDGGVSRLRVFGRAA